MLLFKGINNRNERLKDRMAIDIAQLISVAKMLSFISKVLVRVGDQVFNRCLELSSDTNCNSWINSGFIKL